MVSELGVTRLLCKDAFLRFEEAFDKQEPQIALVDLSHIQYGDIFARYLVGTGRAYHLKTSFEKAKEMVRQKQKSVILYTEVFTIRPYEVGGITVATQFREVNLEGHNSLFCNRHYFLQIRSPYLQIYPRIVPSHLDCIYMNHIENPRRV
jgi:hypothetical protein